MLGYQILVNPLFISMVPQLPVFNIRQFYKSPSHSFGFQAFIDPTVFALAWPLNKQSGGIRIPKFSKWGDGNLTSSSYIHRQ